MKVKKLIVALGFVSGTSSSYAETATNSVVEGSTNVTDTRTTTESDDEQATFSNAFLIGNKTMDLSAFEQGNPQPPGIYDTDISVNGNIVTHEKVTFKALKGDKNQSQPCFTQQQLERFGIDVSKVAAQASAVPDACFPMEQWLPQASARYDVNQQKLIIVVPQAQMQRVARGYVSPQNWDKGITAAILGYNLSGFSSSSDSGNNTSGFIGLNSTVNLGLWQLHYNSTSRITQGDGMTWQRINANVSRPLPGLKSQLTLGESSTSGELFDAIPFRGLQIASDDRMLPDSQRGYAPIIRGVARGNAKVEIWQNNFLLYQTFVTPGPFEVNDLSATGYGGDLRVVITEADSSKQEFTVPFAAVPQLLRPNSTRYSVTAGQVRMPDISVDTNMAQGLLQRGFTNTTTGYTGFLAGQRYQSGILGMAFSTPVGAVSTDVTYAKTSFMNGESYNGNSWRIGYSKLIPQTSTSIALAQYRYSSSGFYTLMQGLQFDSALRRAEKSGFDFVQPLRQRSQSSITVSQSLGDLGEVYVIGSSNQYWGQRGSDTQYQVGYSRSFGSVAVTFSASRTLGGEGQKSNQYFIGLTMPLGRTHRATTLSSNMTFADGSNTQQLYLNGSLNESRSLNYGVTASRSGSQQSSVGLNTQYQGPYALTGASYTEGNNFRTASASASGAAVIHSGGVTFSQQAAETLALVEAKGAEGATISSGSNIRIDKNGYAIVPYMTPYRMNSVDLNPSDTDPNLEFASTSSKVAPYAGAVVKVKFDTKVQRVVLINARDAQQGVLPFGALVFDDKGQQKGMVAQASQLYLREIDEQGRLWVRWETGAGKSACHIDYKLPVLEDKKTFTQLDGVCVMDTATQP